jgi:hypothetical protein
MKKENKTKIDSGVNNEPQFNLDKQLLDNPVYRETNSRDRKRTIYKLIYFFLFFALSLFCGIFITIYFIKGAIKTTDLERKNIAIFDSFLSFFGFSFGTIIYLKLVIKSVKDLLRK